MNDFTICSDCVVSCRARDKPDGSDKMCVVANHVVFEEDNCLMRVRRVPRLFFSSVLHHIAFPFSSNEAGVTGGKRHLNRSR